MTVHPGFGGQSFIPHPLKKISAVKQMASSLSQPPLVGVDGGIDEETAYDVVQAGADVLIAGSAIFHADDPSAAMSSIRKTAEKALPHRS